MYRIYEHEPKMVYRGEIYFIKKAYEGTGCEVSADRPAIIVSNDIGNEHANIVEVVFLTTAEKKPMPTHVPIVCKSMSTALCENIDTVDKSRIGDFIRCCTVDEMNKVDEALMVSLGIPSKKRLQEVSVVDSSKDDQKDAQIRELKQQLEVALKTLDATQTDTAAVVERDLYKRLYEQLLEKITS